MRLNWKIERFFKSTLLAPFIIIIFLHSSCNRQINVVTVENKDIEVKRYQRSEITTIHDFIEIKKGSSTIEIMESNAYGFTEIILTGDTVIIKYMPTVVYKFIDNAFNYTIILDTTITLEDWEQKMKENE